MVMAASYIVLYTPLLEGPHTIAVSVSHLSVEDSPFIAKAEVHSDPTRSIVEGPALHRAVVEVPTILTLITFLPFTKGGEQVTVEVHGPAGVLPIIQFTLYPSKQSSTMSI
jgi:hypothetical protein